MPRACLICNHPKRIEIDRLLVQGKSKTKIALEFDVPTYSLDYHKEHHVSRQMAQRMDRKEALDAVGLMDELQEIVADTKLIFKRNYAKDSASGDTTALRALDSRRATFDTILKACQLYHEAKLLELETSQDRFEQEAKAEYAEKLKLLTTPELEAWCYLTAKMNGEELPEGLVPDVFKTPAQAPPLIVPRPAPEQPVAAGTTPLKADLEPEPIPEQEPEPPPPPPPGLPPRPFKEIPGGGPGLKLRRNLLGRAIDDQGGGRGSGGAGW